MARSLTSTPETLDADALALAERVADVRPLPSVRHLTAAPPAGGAAYFVQARSRAQAQAPHLPAPLRCIDAVEAATQRSLADGLLFERELFLQLLASSESRALRHLFLAERAAAKIPDVPANTPQRNIQSVAVIGAGTMGSGIAMCFLNAGLPVVLLETQQSALDRGRALIDKNYATQVSKGKLTQARYEQRMALLSGTLDYGDLRHADLVIEAVFEDIGAKEAVFRQLDAVCKPGAILASNTSTLNIDQIAAFTQRPQDVLGLHFFSPAQVMKLLEVVRGARTAPEVLATVMALAKTIRKTAVVSGVCDGFIGNRMIEQYLRQAGFLLDEGCTPAQVDQAMEAFGMAMGPFRMSDLSGNDIGWAIRQRRYQEQPDKKYSRTADLLCEQGRFGQKTGAGWYDYVAGQREALPSAAVLQLIEQHRRALGITPRTITDEEIVQRLVFSLVNEAARILEEGIANKASDIDVVYIFGYGFPVHRGGPLHYAHEVGLHTVLQTMQHFALNPLDDAAFWQPAALLARLAAQDQTFA
ncbi:3-hydroxyacyl-CoA dehydrogenase [Simplicispira psychrophila]|uniref:3-hydroxyacyl-CoA dehydrogenase n=1 Tax=Simplicispira psychrophila TaxID=80882 RepID=UPI000A008F00